MMTPIEQIRPLTSLRGAESISSSDQANGTLFGAVFQNAIDNVRTTDAEKTGVQYLLATGQLDNPAASTIASNKYAIAVDLLIQLRNRAVEAYSELTRINI